MNYFRLSFFYLLFIAFISTSVSAQIVQKYGDNNGAINSNSVLELESSNKGLLLPRLALTSITAVAPLSAHVQGMTVYNTATAVDVTPGIYTNNGTTWVRVTDSAILSSYLPLTGGSISGQLTSTVAVGTAPFAVTSTTPVANLSIGGNAATATTATTATNATNTGITNDTTTNATVYPTYVTSTTGNLSQKVANTKLNFNPSTGILNATGFSGTSLSLSGQFTSTVATGTAPFAVTSTTPVANLSIGGNAATATTATNATNTGITNDTATAVAVYPTFVTGSSGNLPQKVTSTKLSFIPSTGILTATGFSGSGAGLTGISASNITTGVLPVDNGGTGVSTIADIQTMLGLAGDNVAIGATAGVINQGTYGVAIGGGSGNDNQGIAAVAVGTSAGAANQGEASVAIGSNAAQSGQAEFSVAIGYAAGQYDLGASSVAIGSHASSYGANSLAIGALASSTGANSIAIGALATTDSYTNSAALGNGASSTAHNTIQLGNTAVTNVSTSGTITAGAVTYPNTHGTANQVLSTTGSGTLVWTDVFNDITATEVALNTKINGVQLYAIQGSFTATGSSTAVTVAKPEGMTGYYSMTTYIGGKTFRKEIFSFDTTTATNNVITGTGPYTEIYPAGTYNYVLEYFK